MLRLPIAFLWFSTNSPFFAPRLNASSPYEPVPAKRSRKWVPVTRSPNEEKSRSLFASVAGLISIPLGICKGIPLADPPQILTTMQYLDVLIPETKIPDSGSEEDCQYAFFLFKQERYLTDYQVCLLSGILITVWPLAPNGNFFHNWLMVVYCLPVGFYLQSIYSKKKYSQKRSVN